MSSFNEGGTSKRPFVFLHVGDLHLTELASGAQQALKDREARLIADLDAIFKDIASIQQGAFDFVYFPGDLAENAGRAEYQSLAQALTLLNGITIRLIPGDHDRARGTMNEFELFRRQLQNAAHRHPGPVQSHVETPLGGSGPPSDCVTYRSLPQYYFSDVYRSSDGKGVRCVFLDMVSAGYGQKGVGLDFRLGKQQTKWLQGEIDEAKKNNQYCAVFMHCYPADIHDPDQASDLSSLFWNSGVQLVEMGHTHYNEIAHDGRTQYATARSVGQNEDGPVGYAVVALDGDVTSWRFKQLQQTWPFVLITSPADRRLAREPLHVRNDGKICVRALILTDQPPLGANPDPCPADPWDKKPKVKASPTTLRYRAWCSVDGGAWRLMDYKGNFVFELWVDWPHGSKTVLVNVTDGRRGSRMQDFIDLDSIEPAERDKTHFTYRSMPDKPGSGAFQVGSWKVKGIRGDQLGPNNGGRKW